MGLRRIVVISMFIIMLTVLISYVLSIDVYLVAGVVIASIYMLGVIVGVIGGIKLFPHKSSFENDNEKAVKLLVDDIDKSHKTIKIVGGIANPKVYNTPEVRTSLENAFQRGVKIQTAFSFTEKNLNKSDNTIIELAKKKMIELYIPHMDKVPRNHFRVMDAISVYSEKEHTRNDVHRNSERFDNCFNIADRFEKAFDTILNNSDMLDTTP